MPDATARGVPAADGMPESPFVVRAAVMRAREDAGAIRAAALREAAQLRAQAAAEAEATRRAAQARGAAEAAALLAAAGVAADAFLRAREDELGELAFAVAQRLVADMARTTRTVALVRTALAEHRDHARLSLRAPPATAAALRTALAALPGTEGRVEVQADASLRPDECVLVRPQGRTALGPLQQFRALMDGIDAGAGVAGA